MEKENLIETASLFNLVLQNVEICFEQKSLLKPKDFLKKYSKSNFGNKKKLSLDTFLKIKTISKAIEKKEEKIEDILKRHNYSNKDLIINHLIYFIRLLCLEYGLNEKGENIKDSKGGVISKEAHLLEEETKSTFLGSSYYLCYYLRNSKSDGLGNSFGINSYGVSLIEINDNPISEKIKDSPITLNKYSAKLSLFDLEDSLENTFNNKNELYGYFVKHGNIWSYQFYQFGDKNLVTLGVINSQFDSKNNLLIGTFSSLKDSRTYGIPIAGVVISQRFDDLDEAISVKNDFLEIMFNERFFGNRNIDNLKEFAKNHFRKESLSSKFRNNKKFLIGISNFGIT